ncbi:hypothetical protein A2U01_0011620, partial [Trifolium medium]|nr:hypothetical protein [Trifolium medium]
PVLRYVAAENFVIASLPCTSDLIRDSTR